MSRSEWESLCDGCARCCLLKLDDKENQTYHYTNVVCRYLDTESCRCTQYRTRSTLVPDCLTLSPKLLIPDNYRWFPSTCAYRLLAEGKDLPWWHPLVSGDTHTVHLAHASVQQKVISEQKVDEDDLFAHIISWAK